MGIPRRMCCKHIPCSQTDIKAPKQVLLSPMVQLDQCCQGEGMEAAIHVPWDPPRGTGSYRADERITGGSACAGRSTWCQAPLFAMRQAMGEMAGWGRTLL